MNIARWLALLLLLGPVLPLPDAHAIPHLFGKAKFQKVNSQLHGQLIDYTRNHGGDRRIWSPALGEKRDLYVYLPPGFDPSQRYPLVVWLHGFAQDEQSFRKDVVAELDAAMACGKLPPAIVAAPDGSLNGHPCIRQAGSFFINTTKGGAYEDFIMQDVWNFLMENFPIRPEREAHAIAGASMGGGGAFNLAIKYRDRIKVVFAFYPPLNTRWCNGHGRYLANFDPDSWGWQTEFRPFQAVARFYCVVTIRAKHLLNPIYDRRDPERLQQIIKENPAEMIDFYQLKDGELCMFVAYSGRDQFNVDAQVESFLYLARQRGLTVTVAYEPRGKHDVETAKRMMPALFHWLQPLLSPYSPPSSHP